MTFKAANIQQATPAQRCPRAGNFTGKLTAFRFHVLQHGFDGGRDWNAKRLSGSALGAGECQDAIFEIDARKRDLRFTETAASGQSNLKGNVHPLRDSFDGQRFPYDFNLIIRKGGFNSGNRAAFNSVIKQSNGVHLSKQATLPMNPFKYLQILARLVPAGLSAGRAGEVLPPFQINFAVISGKCLQTYFFLINKSLKMFPRIQVINFCERGNRMILDQIVDPVVAAFRRVFMNAKSGCFCDCLGPVQGIVYAIAGGLTAPFSVFVFVANEVPRGASFNVRKGHGHNGNIY